jgi:beta-glucuronidase
MHWKASLEKPLIFSEFRYGGADERWTEEYQAAIYQHHMAMPKNVPSLAGLSPWVLMDFRSPRRLLSGVQDYYNRKGLISNQG